AFPDPVLVAGVHRGSTPGAQGRAALLRTPAPGIAKPEGRQHVDRGSLGPAVRHLDADAEIFYVRLGVLDEDVEVPVLVEDAGVDQLVLAPGAPAPAVLLDELQVRELRLRVLVQVLHVRMRWSGS